MNTINEMQKFDYDSYYAASNGVRAPSKPLVQDTQVPKVEVSGKKGRRPAKYYVGKRFNVESGQDPQMEKAAEKYLKKNGVDAYVIANTNGQNRVYIALKNPADKVRFSNYGRNDPKVEAMMFKAVELAGGQGWPSIVSGYNDAKKAEYDKAEAERIFRNKDRIVLHKKDGRTIAVKNDGRTVIEQIDELIYFGVITEDDVNASINGIMLGESSYFNY